MTAANDLREAARLLREIGSSVPQGPWHQRLDDETLTWQIRAGRTGAEIVAPSVGRAAGYLHAMNPAVVLALADALDAEAVLLDATAGLDELVLADELNDES